MPLIIEQTDQCLTFRIPRALKHGRIYLWAPSLPKGGVSPIQANPKLASTLIHST